jgi:Family of unknown function (DUF5681)
MARKPTPKPRSKSAAKKPASAGRQGRGRSTDNARASEQAPNRTTGGRFAKGASGNPGGRPKELDEVKELARTYTERAIERLAEWMDSKDPKASVAACNSLLDRGWGKSVQAITGKDGGPIDVNLNEVRGAIAGKLDRIAAAIEKAGVSR